MSLDAPEPGPLATMTVMSPESPGPGPAARDSDSDSPPVPVTVTCPAALGAVTRPHAVTRPGPTAAGAGARLRRSAAQCGER
jgi:hypothetical protein